MKLPTISTPRFDITLPSSGKVISARPFLVKEQKVILYAVELNSEDQLLNALDDVLIACIFDDIDIYQLPVYDIEYLMLQVRARSVGEIVSINYICSNKIDNKVVNADAMKINSDIQPIHAVGVCETRIPLKVNIAELDCDMTEERPSPKIMFMDTVGVMMQDMKYGDYRKFRTDKSKTEVAMKTISASIGSVIDGDQLHSRTDFSEEDLSAWLEELTSDDYEKLLNYIKTTPAIRSNHKLICPSCGALGNVNLKGLKDFLR